MNIIDREIENYISSMQKIPPAYFEELKEITKSKTSRETMLSGHQVGQFLNMLVHLMNAKTIVEIGMFTGLSALWMTKSPAKDMHLHTLELCSEYADIANLYFEKGQVREHISIHLGSAKENLQKEPFVDMIADFVFIDANKADYPDYAKWAIDHLRSGGLLVVDNTLWEGKVLNPNDKRTSAIHRTNEYLRDHTEVENVLIPFRDGLHLARKL